MAAYLLSTGLEGERAMREDAAEQYYVYLLSDSAASSVYTGVSNNLKKKMGGLKDKNRPGFLREHPAAYLVHFEVFGDPYSAMAREREIKESSLVQKVSLIRSFNHEWVDLSETL